jgi:hypothetical protein
MGDDIYFPGDYNSENSPEENSMKRTRIYLAMGTLIFASLACQAVMGGRNNSTTATPPPAIDNATQPSDVQPTEAPTESNGSSNSSVKTDFPMTADAYNITQVGDGSLVYYTKLSADDALKFYRDAYTAKGYTERQILTVVSNGTFSIVFDGDPSGKAVVIQSVDLGNGSRTIAIRLESV